MIHEDKLTEGLKNAFSLHFQQTVLSSEITWQPTRKEFPGTHTFVLFPWVKSMKKNPLELGNLLGEYLKDNNYITQYNVINGFLNVDIPQSIWIDTLFSFFEKDIHNFFSKKNKTVVIEFSSPNTNKPLHLGHLRNNFLGDSLSRILSHFGYTVHKVCIVNDRGVHICKSILAYIKFGNKETPDSENIKGDHLVGKYYVRFDQEYKKEVEYLKNQGMDAETAEKESPLMKEIHEMLLQWEQGDSKIREVWKTMHGWVYAGFDETYQKIGISFDKIYYESTTYLLGKNIVEEGLKKNIFYTQPDASVWVNVESDKLDKKLLIRSDGTSVYITQDLGTCDMRYKDFPFDTSIYVVGNEQDYHFQVLFAIVKKLEKPYSGKLYHMSYGMVDLPSGKMKSREGTVVDADELLNEMILTAEKHTKELGKVEGISEEEGKKLYKTLGIGALKFFLLKVDPKKRMLFNPQESVEFHGNTAPFIQYTYARISSILRKAKELDGDYTSFKKEQVLKIEPQELILIKIITLYEEIIHQAANEYNPSLIAQYVFDIAKEYNKFYAEYSIFHNEEKNVIFFRIILSATVGKIMKHLMSLLGIDVPEKM